MKVSVPAVRAADAARHRRVEHQQAPRLRGGRDRARGLDVDGRAVDQQRAFVGVLDDAAGAEIDLAHMLAGRQHRDDDVGARAPRSCAVSATAPPEALSLSVAAVVTSTPST